MRLGLYKSVSSGRVAKRIRRMIRSDGKVPEPPTYRYTAVIS